MLVDEDTGEVITLTKDKLNFKSPDPTALPTPAWGMKSTAKKVEDQTENKKESDTPLKKNGML